MKKSCRLLALLVLIFSMTGCSLLDKEYISVTDYSIPEQTGSTTTDSISVHSFNELKKAILSLCTEGLTEGAVVFDSEYSSDPQTDLTQACWQVRSQNALCAYCVKNIEFELSKIVGYTDATLTICYSETAEPMENIVQLQYMVGLDEIIHSALDDNRTRLVISVVNSSVSSSVMQSMVMDVYHDYPASCAAEPQVHVILFSGSGRQRLYEISLDTGLTEDEIISRKSQLMNLDVYDRLNMTVTDAPDSKALAACRYLTEQCVLTADTDCNSLYDALIRGEADSEGLALAYRQLCRELGIDCTTVYGTQSGVPHCWNIIRLGENYYHVDVSQCMTSGLESGFLLNDETMWNLCRWDIASYESCTGDLKPDSIPGWEETLPAEETEQDSP